MSANPLGIAIIAIVGLVAGLYILEKKFGVVTKAWKMFSESSIGKGVFAAIADGKKAIEDLLGTLGKAYKAGGVGGVLKVALEGIVANSPLLKMVAFVVEFLRKIWANSTTLNKLFSAGTVIWQRIADFFSWLLNAINSAITWLRDGLGVTKSEKKAKMESLAEKEGVVWSDKKNTWVSKSSSQPVKVDAALERATADYEKAPKGFFEGIPGMDALQKAMEDLIYALKHPVAAATAAASSAGSAVAAASQSTMNSDIQKVNEQIAAGQPVSSLSTDMGNPSGLLKIGYKALTGKDLAWPSADVGGSIIGSGGLIGHGGEQVTPAAEVAIGEKTTLAKINEMFAGASGTGGQPITVNAPITLNVAKIDSSVDLEKAMAKAGEEFDRKLLFRLRNSLDSGNSRGIGYLRG